MSDTITFFQSTITRSPKLIQEKLDLGFKIIVKKAGKYLYTISKDDVLSQEKKVQGVSAKTLQRVKKMRSQAKLPEQYKGMNFEALQEIAEQSDNDYSYA